MRVLWFSNTPSNYIMGTNPYNGGGWISSLESSICNKDEIELGIAFILKGEPQKVKKNSVTYYVVSDEYNKSYWAKIKKQFVSNSKRDGNLINSFLGIINDFKPDIIEIFGSEGPFGLIAKHTEIPILLHVQGILNPYLNAYLPPFFSKWDYFFSDCNPFNIRRRIAKLRNFANNAEREISILKSVNNYAGRTTWDKRVISLFNSEAQYFNCSEILRPEFYEIEERTIPQELTIVSTISDPLYKGFDLILKTAFLLKKHGIHDFTWKVFGNVYPQVIEKIAKIDHKAVNVKLCGVASPGLLKETMLNCTVYVHPSYIDNSPNSICEAQILGCPVIATNVGGVSSLIEDGITGYLIPANDPYQLAYLIADLFQDPAKCLRIGSEAKRMARKRHDKGEIVNQLINIYHRLLYCNGSK